MTKTFSFLAPAYVAAITGLILPLASRAQTPITFIDTDPVNTGGALSRGPLTGFSNAPIPGTSTYAVNYDGIEVRRDFVVSGGDLWAPDTVNLGVAYVRRNTATAAQYQNEPKTTAWNAIISGDANASAHVVSGNYLNTMDALFTSRNLLSGTENLFVNYGDANNTSSNVERVDYLFGSSFLANSDTAFSVLERGRGVGGNGANGGFKVAAVLSVDSFGVPNAFGNTVIHVTDDSYNNGGVGAGLPTFRYDVFSGTNLDDIANVDIGPQTIAGVIIRATDLVAPGTPIFGYAVFGEDVSGTGADLVNWDNPTFYPQNSTTANDVDLVASGAVIFRTTEVPEASTTAALVVVGAMVGGAFLRRRTSGK